MGVSDRSLMTWEPKKSRWRKMHRGKIYTVSCVQLGTPETKEGSYAAANEWWRKKQAELDLDASHVPHQDTVDQLARKRDWARSHDEPEIATALTRRIEHTRRLRANEDPSEDYSEDMVARLEAARMFGIVIPDDLDPDVARQLFGDGRTWAERFERQRTASKVPDDLTVGGQVKEWLAGMLARCQSGSAMSAGQYDNLRRASEAFRDWHGGEKRIETVNEGTLKKWYEYLLQQVAEGKIARETAKSRFRQSKQFIGDICSLGVIPFPKNFHKKWVFGSSANEIKPMSVEEVRLLVSRATGQLRLHLLIMLNCGFTQFEVSELRRSEVDWKRGAITRKRIKTRGAESVPIVTWRLWPETFRLLQEWDSGGDLVLLTKSGKRWAWEEHGADGSYKSSDSIATNYRRLVSDYKAEQEKRKKEGQPVRIAITGSLKDFRKTGATMIERHPVYGRYKSHYLGHSPKSVADKHYAAPSPELFDEIMAWLGTQFGF